MKIISYFVEKRNGFIFHFNLNMTHYFKIKTFCIRLKTIWIRVVFEEKAKFLTIMCKVFTKKCLNCVNKLQNFTIHYIMIIGYENILITLIQY